MWPDRVSNPGPLTYESGALPTALRGPAGSHDLFATIRVGLSEGTGSDLCTRGAYYGFFSVSRLRRIVMRNSRKQRDLTFRCTPSKIVIVVTGAVNFLLQSALDVSKSEFSN